MSWDQVSASRLGWHGLIEPLPADPSEIVRRMCGAHAQVMSAAEVSIGIRSHGLTCGDVRRSLWQDRTLVKTYAQRGTVHLLPADDLPAWTTALAAVPHTSTPTRQMAMTDAQTEAVLAAVRDALATGGPLTLTELDDAVVARAGGWAGDLVMPAFQTFWPRWRQKLAAAARRGYLIFGPARGRLVTYVAPAAWLGPRDPPPAEDALAWLLTSYLRAYGPARPEDLARWLATDARWARQVFDRHADRLRPLVLGGMRMWVLADQALDAPTTGKVLLLPYFDSYVVGGQPRELLFPNRARQRAQPPGGGAGNFPVVLVDGVVAGVWHQRRVGRRLETTVELLRPAGARVRAAIERAAERVAAVQDRRCDVAFGEVTVGGHA